MSVQTTPSTQITGLDLIGAAVPNLDRALAYYRALGLVTANSNDDGAEFHFPDGSTFGLYQPPSGSPVRPGFTVFFRVGDAAEAAQAINARGGTLGGTAESDHCAMAFGEDPEGNKTVVHRLKVHEPHTPPAQAHTPTTIKGIDLAGYLVADVAATLAYYRDTLGMSPTWIDPEGRGAEFELPDGQAFGIWHTPDAKRGGFVMFAVDDASAKVAELRVKGVPIGDPLELPDCIMAFGPDPEGNSVIIHQRKGHG